MSDFRIEKDSMGEVQVPANAWYGSQTQRAKDNFPISDLRFPRRFIEALALIKKSAAKANNSMGELDDDKMNAICQAADRVMSGELDDQFILDIFQTGSGTSSNMNANEVISNVATVAMGGTRGQKLVHPNDHVNMAQSSNDVIPTAMHIAAKVALDQELLPALRDFKAGLEAKAAEFDNIIKSGRTHLMDATPVRLGQEFGGYAAQIGHAIKRIERASEELSELALGGTATGTGINCDPEFPKRTIAAINEATGLSFVEASNHFEAQGAKDAYVSTAGALNTLASAVLKIANDIRWLGSGPTSGLGEIMLPDLQPGSSIMPGKVNPVMSEALMMLASKVMGNVVTITVANTHGNFELNVMMPVMAHAMLESITILANGLNAFRTKCLDGIKANEARCKELLELNPSIATALNKAIGYDQASIVAKKSGKEHKSVRQVVKELGLMDDAHLDSVLDVRSMTEPGIPK